ncbi:hypothetical protein [Streptomyces sp. NPDC059378]
MSTRVPGSALVPGLTIAVLVGPIVTNRQEQANRWPRAAEV